MLDDTRMQVLELAAQGYSCAQIVMILGLRLTGRENPDLIRAMSALAMGARYGSICGALTGGLCLIGVHTGKGNDGERPLPSSSTLMGALTTWFMLEELGGRLEPDCSAILEARGHKLDLAAGSSFSGSLGCADLAAHTWVKALSLLRENGLDPTLGREEVIYE